MAVVKLRILPVVFLFSIASIVALVHTQTAIGQGASPERCSRTQNYLKNIQKPRDLRARVDRLQAYRYIYQRLDVFVVRLEKNSQPFADNLRVQLNELEKVTESFKNNYEAYDRARDAAASSKDCQNKFEEFQSKLNKARQLRQEVYADVVAIQQLLSEQINGQLGELQRTLLATGSTGVEND